MRELNGASPNRARTALHQDGAAFNRTRHMNSLMSGDAGNTETGTLLQRHVCRQGDRLLNRHHGIFGGSAKVTVRLRPVAPHTPSDPLLSYVFAHNINCPAPSLCGMTRG